MSVTIYQIQDALQLPMFLKRIDYALASAAVAIVNEASGTVNHVARVTLAKSILNGVGGYAPRFAQGVITQLSLSTTNLLSNPPDLDTTDALIASTISSIYNGFI